MTSAAVRDTSSGRAGSRQGLRGLGVAIDACLNGQEEMPSPTLRRAHVMAALVEGHAPCSPERMTGVASLVARQDGLRGGGFEGNDVPIMTSGRSWNGVSWGSFLSGL
jgi:hypothetical protein